MAACYIYVPVTSLMKEKNLLAVARTCILVSIIYTSIIIGFKAMSDDIPTNNTPHQAAFIYTITPIIADHATLQRLSHEHKVR